MLARGTWTSLRDRAVRYGFIAFENAMALLSRTPKLRILFSTVKRGRSTVERSFRFTPHEIHFGEFDEAKLADFDVLVPLLRVDAARSLDDMRAQIDHNLLPAPSRRAIDLCDDKLAFHEHMTA